MDKQINKFVIVFIKDNKIEWINFQKKKGTRKREKKNLRLDKSNDIVKFEKYE